jgi:hypothetical protein
MNHSHEIQQLLAALDTLAAQLKDAIAATARLNSLTPDKRPRDCEQWRVLLSQTRLHAAAINQQGDGADILGILAWMQRALKTIACECKRAGVGGQQP